MHILVTRLHDRHQRRMPLKSGESLDITRAFVCDGRAYKSGDKYVSRGRHAVLTRVQHRLYLRNCHDNEPTVCGPVERLVRKDQTERVDGYVVRFALSFTTDLHFEVDGADAPESLPPTHKVVR